MNLIIKGGGITISKQNAIYILIAIFIVIAGWGIFQIYSLAHEPASYVIAKNGTVSNVSEVTAYVVRDEQLLDTSGYSGDREMLILDGNKVAAGKNIALYSMTNSDEEKKQIQNINEEIQELMVEKESEHVQDLKSTEKSIEELIYSMIDNKQSIYDISLNKQDILTNLESKATIVGASENKNSTLNTLLAEKDSFTASYKKSQKAITSPSAGLVSYRIDGYENTFNKDNLLNLSLAKLSKIKYSANEPVQIDDNKIKIINNFYTYLALIVNDEEANELKLGDKLKISYDDNYSNTEKCEIVYISKDEEKDIVVVKTYTNSEELSKYRVVNVNLVWWTYSGIKVPLSSIYETTIKDDEKEYATVKALKTLGTTGYEKEIYIKVEKESGNFAIVSNYEDEELTELGVPEDIISDRYTLSLYDRVVTTK